MTKAELARQAAIDRVGDAYVYGAWDQSCTVGNRNRYANLNPEYKDAIKNQCPRMKSGKSSCAGCKYEGRRIHDCRGLTSVCAKAAGIVIDGQTVAKQWNADVWAEKGTIDTLPKELPYVQLFRYNGSKWTHTGIYIGSGETVDASGHASGVVRGKLTAYPWTHWAIPKGLYSEGAETSSVTAEAVPPSPKGEGREGSESVIWTGIVTTQGGRLNIREKPDIGSRVIGSLMNGEKVDILEEQNGWGKLGDSVNGWVSLNYLRKASESAQDAAQGGEGETPAQAQETQPDVNLTANPAADAGATTYPTAAAVPPSPQSWEGKVFGVFIPCDSEDEAMRYAGNIKNALILRAEKPPDAAKGE